MFQLECSMNFHSRPWNDFSELPKSIFLFPKIIFKHMYNFPVLREKIKTLKTKYGITVQERMEYSSRILCSRVNSYAMTLHVGVVKNYIISILL